MSHSSIIMISIANGTLDDDIVGENLQVKKQQQNRR
jgi:hypothetical protein